MSTIFKVQPYLRDTADSVPGTTIKQVSQMFLVILSPQLRSGEDGYSWLEMAVFPLTHGGLDLTGIGYFP